MKNKKTILMLIFIAVAINIIIAQTPITDFEYELITSDTGKLFRYDDDDEKKGVYLHVRKVDTVAITKYLGRSSHVIIPASIDGYPVTEVWSIFEKNKNIKSVVIPDSVEVLAGTFAFTNITDIVLPDSIKLMSGTFYSSKITNIKLPKNLKAIGDYAFAYCKNLENINLPSSLEFIGIGTFNSSGLRSIILPDSLRGIGMAAFKYCEFLEKIRLPNNKLAIPYEMCQHCKNLTTIENLDYIYFDNSFSYSGDYINSYREAFKGCNKLKISVRKALINAGYNNSDF